MAAAPVHGPAAVRRLNLRGASEGCRLGAGAWSPTRATILQGNRSATSALITFNVTSVSEKRKITGWFISAAPRCDACGGRYKETKCGSVEVLAIWQPLSAATFAFAKGTLTGTVRDASGSVLPGVNVEASSTVRTEKSATWSPKAGCVPNYRAQSRHV